MSNAQITPGLLIDGRKEKYGGFAYNASVSFSFGEKPLNVKVSFVRKRDEEFSIPTIGLNNQSTININGLNIKNLYLYKYIIKKSTQADIMEVYYTDGSFVLDKYYVGIQGKHGFTSKYQELLKDRLFYDDKNPEKSIDYLKRLQEYKKKLKEGKVGQQILEEDMKKAIFEQQGNLLIIGRAFHPCDTNNDNFIDPKENGYDLCDPCPNCPNDKYDFTCFEQEQMKLFHFSYSFEDFINGLKKIKWSNSVTMNIEDPKIKDKKAYEKYYRDYHGPLREVLTSWANDFGLTWYYDFEKKYIKFLDSNSEDIKIQGNEYKTYLPDKLISYETSQSIEDSISYGVISWYEREGERKNFECSKNQAVALSPVFGTDLLGNAWRSIKGAGSVKNVNGDDDCVSAILQAYYPPMRDSFWLRNIYQINDIEAARKITINPEEININVDDPDEDEEKEIQSIGIPEMGHMIILAVIDGSGSNPNNKFETTANSKYEDLYNSLNDAERITFKKNHGFFIAAYQDETAFTRRIEKENELFNFMGRFHIREHLTRVCNITGTEEFVKANTSIETSDGSAQIYTKKEGFHGNPMDRFKYFSDGYLGCVFPTKKEDIGNKNEIPRPDKFNPGEFKFGKGINLQKNSFIYKDVGAPSQPMNAKIEEGYYPSIISDTYWAGDGSYFSIYQADSKIPSKLNQTSIILERDPKWFPNVEDYQVHRKSLDKSHFFSLQLKQMGVDGQTASTDFTSMALSLAKGNLGKDSSKIKFFVIYPGEAEIKIKKLDDHPTDKTMWDKNETKLLAKRLGGKQSSFKLGLLNGKCHKITMKTKFNGEAEDHYPEIITPPFSIVQGAYGANARKKDLIKNFKNRTKPCDQLIIEELEGQGSPTRPASYRVNLIQSYNQTIIVPKIFSGIYGNTTPEDDALKFDVNYNYITNEDIKDMTGYAGYGCYPNTGVISKILERTTGTITKATKGISGVSVKFRGKFDQNSISTLIKNGLSYLNLYISEEGAINEIIYNTKPAVRYSEDLIKFKRRVGSL